MLFQDDGDDARGCRLGSSWPSGVVRLIVRPVWMHDDKDSIRFGLCKLFLFLL